MMVDGFDDDEMMGNIKIAMSLCMRRTIHEFHYTYSCSIYLTCLSVCVSVGSCLHTLFWVLFVSRS